MKQNDKALRRNIETYECLFDVSLIPAVDTGKPPDRSTAEYLTNKELLGLRKRIRATIKNPYDFRMKQNLLLFMKQWDGGPEDDDDEIEDIRAAPPAHRYE